MYIDIVGIRQVSDACGAMEAEDSTKLPSVWKVKKSRVIVPGQERISGSPGRFRSRL